MAKPQAIAAIMRARIRDGANSLATTKVSGNAAPNPNPVSNRQIRNSSIEMNKGGKECQRAE